jgi:hypothetical protein
LLTILIFLVDLSLVFVLEFWGHFVRIELTGHIGNWFSFATIHFVLSYESFLKNSSDQIYRKVY